MNSDNSPPKVSIGMPVFNGADEMRRAIDSLLAQDFDDFEMIISDNHSTDETWEVCQEYADKDPRIHISRNEENIGIMANFKKVLADATGTYFMWAAVDDFWEPAFLSTLVADLEAHPEAGVTLCGFDVFWDDGEHLFTFALDEAHNPNNMSKLQTAIMFYEPIKVNYFFYGLFRRSVLAANIYEYQPIGGVERWFLAKMALVTPFRYVDEVLHVRTNARVKFANRYPDDPLSKSFVTQAETFIDTEPYTTVARFLLGHEEIPAREKLGVFPLFIAYARHQLRIFKYRADRTRKKWAYKFRTQKSTS